MVGRATKRAAQELTGDDGNFVVTTDLGNEFATAGLRRPCTGRSGPRTATPSGPTTRGPTRRCSTARPRTWRSSRPTWTAAREWPARTATLR